MKAVAIIPARGGSKRIPRKNVRSLCGRPMIAYTIGAARNCGLFEQVIVSTDDPEIASIAVAEGADVPFLRESRLADDYTPVSAATLDALRRVDSEGVRFSCVAQLMANCPLRTARDILESLDAFASKGAPSQISVTRFQWQNPWWALKQTDTGLQPLFPNELAARSQDLPELFCPTGAIWWCHAETLRREGTFHLPNRVGWEIPWSRAVDIDSESDFEFAEFLIEREKREDEER